MLGRPSPYPRMGKLRQQPTVQSVAKLFDRWVHGVQDHRFFVIWLLPLWFGVDAEHVAPIPYFVHELFQIPFVL